jgi:hypothetical protein
MILMILNYILGDSSGQDVYGSDQDKNYMPESLSEMSE